MRNSWLALLTVLAMLSISDNARCEQEVLDLLIEKALQNYPELPAANYSAEAARYMAATAGSWPNPQIHLGLEKYTISSFVLYRSSKSAVAIGLSQGIPWPGKLSAKANAAKVQYQRSETNVAAIENRVVREVTQTYYEYAYWHESSRIIEDYVKLLEATLKVMERRYANGDATAQEVLSISTKLSRTKVQWLDYEQNSHGALLVLWQYVGDSSVLVDLPTNLRDTKIEQSDKPLGIGGNPSLVDAELAVNQSRFMHKEKKAGFWPDFDIGFEYSVHEEDFAHEVDGNKFLSFKFGVELPLWFFSRQSKEAKSAEYMMYESRENLRRVRESLGVQLEHAQYAQNATVVSIRQYQNSILPEAKAALEAAEIAYEVGQIDFNALLMSQADLYDVQLEHLDLLRRYNQTNALIAELSGSAHERESK